MPAATFKRVALAKVGTHSASTGRVAVSLEDLQEMARASRDPQAGVSVIKIGHLDPRMNNPQYDGEPVYGQVVNLAVEDDTLYGDLINVPEQLAASMPTAYPSRSVEIGYNMRTRAGKVLKRVLTAVALLGATRPAIKDLGDVLTATASAAPEDTETVVALSALDDDADLPPSEPNTPDDDHTTTGGTVTQTATPTAVLTALGLPEDADEAAVLAKIEELKPEEQPPAGTADDPPAGTPAAGDVVLTPAQVATFSEMAGQLATLQQWQADRIAQDAAAAIDGAIKRFSEDEHDGGRITPVTEPLWRAQLAKDFEGTVALLSASPRLYHSAPVGAARAPESGTSTAHQRALADAAALGLRVYETPQGA